MINTKFEKIAIWGVPRSGTSWLGQIFNSSPNIVYRFQPLFSQAFKHGLSAFSSKSDIEDFFNEILKTNDDFILNGLISESEKLVLKFKKKRSTHIVMKHVRYLHIVPNILKKCDNIKIVGIVRNPCAVLSSWFNSKKEFKKEWTLIEEWKNGEKKNINRQEEFFGYYKWKQVAYLFEELKKYQNFYLIDYNNLLLNTNKEIEEIFKFSNIKLTNQTINFLKKSKDIDCKDDYSVLKKKDNDFKWKESLPTEIVTFIRNDLNNTILEKYLS